MKTEVKQGYIWTNLNNGNKYEGYSADLSPRFLK